MTPQIPHKGRDKLVRVVAPHFVAGLITDGERCLRAAPILKWTIGKDEDFLRGYFKRKGWKASVIVPKGQKNQG